GRLSYYILFLYFLHTRDPQGPNALKPGKCCFNFFTGRIPVGEIRSIAKTHESCTKRGFVINTPRGDYCVNMNQKWAIKAFLNTPKEVAAFTSLPVKTA
uniref:Chemokine interleukin-8-like domain-containing protein n=1 Tax=Poecilia reticulata TaxID=8081 RepID=A0A3P9N366_POERE